MLESETNCTTCAVKLSVNFANPTNYTDFGKYLDSVNFSVASKKISSMSLISTPAGTNADWDFGTGSLSGGNQCQGPSPRNQGCGAWVPLTAGFGPIEDGMSLEWLLSVTFTSELTSFTTGNVRAAFNTATGSNTRTFSPSDLTSCVADDCEPVVAPEPASMLLMGLGLLGLAARFRRQE